MGVSGLRRRRQPDIIGKEASLPRDLAGHMQRYRYSTYLRAATA